MTEMREWWANVYRDGCGVKVGRSGKTRWEAQVMNGEHGGTPNHALFRIHVRLKPEGAPKRYAGPWERRVWEGNTHEDAISLILMYARNP